MGKSKRLEAGPLSDFINTYTVFQELPLVIVNPKRHLLLCHSHQGFFDSSFTLSLIILGEDLG